jgi:hypothetical protein
MLHITAADEAGLLNEPERRFPGWPHGDGRCGDPQPRGVRPTTAASRRQLRGSKAPSQPWFTSSAGIHAKGAGSKTAAGLALGWNQERDPGLAFMGAFVDSQGE